MNTSPICPKCNEPTDGLASVAIEGTRVHMDCLKVEAHKLGAEAAKTAATWATDGNTSEDHYRRMIAWQEDGDERFSEHLPTCPNLSGEWADAPVAITLYEEVTGLDHAEQEEAAGLGYETLVGYVVDTIANAWEAGVAETFEVECERLIRAAVA